MRPNDIHNEMTFTKDMVLPNSKHSARLAFKLPFELDRSLIVWSNTQNV